MTVTPPPEWVRPDLDPGLLRQHTYTSRRRRHLVDVSALLSLMIATLFLVPSVLGAPQMSTVGRPAHLVGAVLAVAWLATRAHPDLAVRGPQPMRVAVAIWLVTLLLSYAAGQGRGLTDAEARSTDLIMLYLLIFCGVVLACADGIASRERLGRVVRVLVWSAAGMAVIGLLQALADVDLAEYLVLPGLEFRQELVGLQQRAGFHRIASTTGHFIEFSAVMAVTLPFAVHLARFGDTRLVRQMAIVCGLLIASVIPLTLSRTGILAVLATFLVMLPLWSWRVRFNLVALALGLVALAILARPRLMGTLRSLFTNWESDNSIQGRTNRYDAVLEYVRERPLLGRGPGTFLPDQYLLLDNQWLATLVSNGVVGVIGLVIVHGVAATLAVATIRQATTPQDRHLAGCLLAAQVIAVIAAGTFDSFAFTTFTTTIAICTGLTAALWRLSHPRRSVRTASSRLGRA